MWVSIIFLALNIETQSYRTWYTEEYEPYVDSIKKNVHNYNERYLRFTGLISPCTLNRQSFHAES